MKRTVILAMVASAPALMAQTATPQGPAGAAPTLSTTPATTIVFSQKGANGMSDLPMGVHRIPDSDVVVSGYQGGGGIGMLFGVVGMLVQSSMNAQTGTGKVRNVEDDLRFDVRAKAIEMTNTVMAGDKFRRAFTLTPQPGGSTMTVAPWDVPAASVRRLLQASPAGRLPAGCFIASASQPVVCDAALHSRLPAHGYRLRALSGLRPTLPGACSP